MVNLTYADNVDLRTAFDSLSRHHFCYYHKAPDSRQTSHFNQGSVQQLDQLCSRIPICEYLVHSWIWWLLRVCGTRLFHHRCGGLVAGKNCWHRHEWHVIWSTLIFRSGFCRWCRFTCRATWTPCACTWDDGIRGCISWARGELAEDKSPSFGQQGGWAINNHSLRTGGWSGWKLVYLGSFDAFLISHVAMPSLVWYAEPKQSHLEVNNFYFH